MSKILITTTLKALAKRFDYVIVCDDIKMVIGHVEHPEGIRAQRQIEMDRPVEYNSKYALEVFGGNKEVIKWDYTFTDNGDDAVAVVLGK